MFILQIQISTARTCRHTISCMTCQKSTSRRCSPLLNPPFAHLSSGQTMSFEKTRRSTLRNSLSLMYLFLLNGCRASVWGRDGKYNRLCPEHSSDISDWHPIRFDVPPDVAWKEFCPPPNCFDSLYPIPFNVRVAHVLYLLLLCGGHRATDAA